MGKIKINGMETRGNPPLNIGDKFTIAGHEVDKDGYFLLHGKYSNGFFGKPVRPVIYTVKEISEKTSDYTISPSPKRKFKK